MRMAVLRLEGHCAGGPRGVAPQSHRSMSSPISPPPLNRSSSARRGTESVAELAGIGVAMESLPVADRPRR